MRSFTVRYSDETEAQLAYFRRRIRSAKKRQRHDEARILVEAELETNADEKGWPHSANRFFRVIDEHPLRFIFWDDHPIVWIVEVDQAPQWWWLGFTED